MAGRTAALAGGPEDPRELARGEDEQQRQGRGVEPSPDRGADEAGDQSRR